MALTFIEATQGLGTTNGWSATAGTTPPAVDTSVKVHGYGSTKLTGGATAPTVTSAAASVTATSRLSVWATTDTISNNRIQILLITSGGSVIFAVQLKSGGTWTLSSGGAGTLNKSGTKTSVANTFDRIALGWTITSTTVFTINVFFNGSAVADIAATGADGTLATTAADRVRVSGVNAAGSITWMQDLICDSGTTNDDLAGAGNNAYVTAKLPTGNGVNNAYTTNGTPTGTGTGHAPYINDRPWSSSDFLNQTSAGSLDEDYAIQAAGTGDDDISAATVLGNGSWQVAALTGSGASPTMSNFNDGTVTAFTPAATATFVPSNYTTSATYPATTPICGQRSTKGSAKVPNLYAAGVIVAYTVSTFTAAPQFFLLFPQGLG